MFRSLKKKEFSYVYKKGKSKVNKYLVLYVLKTKEPALGISVSKKVGNSVVRHRIKRLIKESFRLNSDYFDESYSYIFIAKKNANTVGYREIESAVKHLVSLQGLNKKC